MVSFEVEGVKDIDNDRIIVPYGQINCTFFYDTSVFPTPCILDSTPTIRAQEQLLHPLQRGEG